MCWASVGWGGVPYYWGPVGDLQVMSPTGMGKNAEVVVETTGPDYGQEILRNSGVKQL